MSKTIQHLSPSQWEDLKDIAKKIAIATKADKLICFGNRSSKRNEWTPLFVPGKEYHESTKLEYDLLLIKPPGDNRTEDEMADIVKDISGTSPGITCVVCSTEEVLEDLATGARFMITIYDEGLML